MGQFRHFLTPQKWQWMIVWHALTGPGPVMVDYNWSPLAITGSEVYPVIRP